MSDAPRWSSGSRGDRHGQPRQEIVFFAATVLLVMAVLPAGLLLGPFHLGEGEAARLAAVLTFIGVLVTASVSLIGFMVNRQTEHRLQTEQAEQSHRLRLDSAMRGAAVVVAHEIATGHNRILARSE